MSRKPPEDLLSMEAPGTYRIVVRGVVHSDWAARLSGMHISQKTSAGGAPETVLVGRLPDQAALSGVLNALYELHLPIISADCLEVG